MESVCEGIDVVGAIRDLFRLHGSGQTVLPEEAYLGWKNDLGEQVRSLNMPGYVGGSLNIAGTKIINGNIANPSRGLPRASGLTMVYDKTSVRINCVMEGAYLSSLRTACVTALSADVFKGREIEQVAVIGAGVLAQAHIELLAKRLPHLSSIRIFDISSERIASLRAEVSALLQAKGVELRETATAEEAIRAAQLIIPATTTTSGYIPFAWLQPGAILVNISLDDPLPEVVFKAAKVVVDDWKLVKDDPRRLIGRMYRAGQIIGPDEPADEQSAEGQQRRRIDAELGEVVAGKKEGRQHLDDIILMNPFGMSIEDVTLAAHVYQKALEMNIGVWLER
ncbi:ornithine cyclodeaminase family protein [Ktedonosporobacter rubrisoli]|uniref:ornithine cyclodeaminase family protein n=1 Tax=Ktedonosporobacter rubrisoli TaxID=2509675 RepID=UPI0013EE7F55|nr:ornithine cyclodeaminase [Ktedonosporobacter rubrisoli]